MRAIVPASTLRNSRAAKTERLDLEQIGQGTGFSFNVRTLSGNKIARRRSQSDNRELDRPAQMISLRGSFPIRAAVPCIGRVLGPGTGLKARPVQTRHRHRIALRFFHRRIMPHPVILR